MAAPVRDAGLTLIESGFRRLSRFTLGLLLKTVVATAIVIFLVIAVRCGCTAAYLALASIVGAAPAFLIVALLFLVLAALMVTIAVEDRMELRPSAEPMAALMRVADRAPGEAHDFDAVRPALSVRPHRRPSPACAARRRRLRACLAPRVSRTSGRMWRRASCSPSG